MSLLQTLLATLVTLGVLVTIHEWGHFFVARRCGVKVLRFCVGFGKPIWMHKGKDGTEYAVAAIPLGGFVAMLDEREGGVPEELREQAFNNKPVLSRIAIVAAGPVVNLVFAVLAYWALFMAGVQGVVPTIGQVVPESPAAQAEIPAGAEIVAVGGKETRSWNDVNLRLASWIGESGTLTVEARAADGSLNEYQADLDNWSVDLETTSPLAAFGLRPYQPDLPAVVGQVVKGSPAAQAGIESGDRIVSINGHAVKNWQALVSRVRTYPGENLDVEVRRDNQSLTLALTPERRIDGDGNPYGFMGIGAKAQALPADMVRDIHYGPVDALVHGANKTWDMITLTLDSIRKMIVGSISVKNLSGPITIAKVAGASAASGLESFISFLAYLSVSLGVLNLLPIPMLDGGHLLYHFVELVRGKPVSERVQMVGLRIGMALLFSVMALAVFNDLTRL